MNLGEYLVQISQCLHRAGSAEAHLEAEVILRHITKLDRTHLYLELEREIRPSEDSTLRSLIQRRIQGEPLPYIIGSREFYGLEFYVNSSALIPRPETELLVEKTVQMVERLRINSPLIADIGTGCGAIAISLAKEIPSAILYATDISGEALNLAKINCARHNVSSHVTILQGAFLDAIPNIDVAVANLPYVKRNEIPASTYEPRLALDGGVSGLTHIRQLIRQFASRPAKALILEIGAGQADAVTKLVHQKLPAFTVEIASDLSGIDRVVSVFHDCSTRST